jgi:hypothetical protein
VRRATRIVVLLMAVALGCCSTAAADLVDEQALAKRFAPDVRLVEQTEECGHGEPYIPTNVDVLFGEPTVALRGPWNRSDLVKIAPTARDLVGLYDYHLDFPGNPLEPGCGYERWARRLTKGTSPTVYAHVVSERDRPGHVALQYWFFYPFNDFNNLHEGDWEMIQLVFDAPTARAALATRPAEVGYSSHEGAERASWGDDKLELVAGTHPVVYVAAGSHANKFTSALYLGSSAEQGVGCDDTRGPHTDVRPVVQTIPSNAAAARRAFPWIAFEGRWGELERAFFNGPTGPNLKTQWIEPIRWADDWRDRSYAVPASGIFGTGATDFFCGAVATGSAGLVRLLRNPQAMLIALGVLLAAVIFGVTRTRWRPAAPLRVGRRRYWGQILAAAARIYVSRPAMFLGIGALLVPLALLISLVQALVLGGFGLLGVETTGDSAGALALLIVGLGTTLTILGLALVQAATACALGAIDAGRTIGPVHAYRMAFGKFPSLLGGVAFAVVVWVLLSATVVLLPVAVWLAIRWSLLAQVVELEGLPARAALRRSAQLVRHHWLRVASLVGVGAVLALALGPLIGALLILLSHAPLPLLNVVSGIVYALTMPLVALTTTYVYFDVRTRFELEPAGVTELPAEIQHARPDLQGSA